MSDTAQKLETFQYKELTFERLPSGGAITRCGGLTFEYWPHRDGGDPWRYEQIYDGRVQTFSHPSEHGCQIMIRKSLIQAGLITMPFDNSHLDEKDEAIRAETFKNYDARETVRNGDYLKLPDGTYKRVCYCWDHGAQVTRGGSFSISKGGGVSYSGGLDPAILYERFKPADETKPGTFWFFHHGFSGGGRGIDVWHDCRVYELIDLSMTEQEAREHPVAKDCAEFWGENHREHIARIAALMRGEFR